MCDRRLSCGPRGRLMPSDVPRRRLGRLPRTAFAFGCTGCVAPLDFSLSATARTSLGHYMTIHAHNPTCAARAHKCKMMHKPTTTSLRCSAIHRTRCVLDPRTRQQAVLARSRGRVKIMATRLDHLEMVLERRWYDCSNCRRLPRSDRSALVGGCIETTAGVENEGQAVQPAWHCAAARHIGRTQIDTPKIRTVGAAICVV